MNSCRTGIVTIGSRRGVTAILLRDDPITDCYSRLTTRIFAHSKTLWVSRPRTAAAVVPALLTTVCGTSQRRQQSAVRLKPDFFYAVLMHKQYRRRRKAMEWRWEVPLCFSGLGGY